MVEPATDPVAADPADPVAQEILPDNQLGLDSQDETADGTDFMAAPVECGATGNETLHRAKPLDEIDLLEIDSGDEPSGHTLYTYAECVCVCVMSRVT